MIDAEQRPATMLAAILISFATLASAWLWWYALASSPSEDRGESASRLSSPPPSGDPQAEGGDAGGEGPPASPEPGPVVLDAGGSPLPAVFPPEAAASPEPPRAEDDRESTADAELEGETQEDLLLDEPGRRVVRVAPGMGDRGATDGGRSAAESVRRGGKATVVAADDTIQAVSPDQRPLELPGGSIELEPPPAGRARFLCGSIPVERRLEIDGQPVNSFRMARQSFSPGRHRVLLESSRGCVVFEVSLAADERVHLIRDFDAGRWRRSERQRAGRTTPFQPDVQPCGA